MRVERISLTRINPAPYNPRKDLKPGDPEYEKLKRSVERWDLVEPLVWNERTGTLVGGHQRLKILAARGDTEVDVSIVDLDERDEQALNVALNRIQGEWDEPKLADILAGLNMDGFDATVTGFDMAELERIVAANTEVEDEGEVDLTPPAKPKSKRGEVYELGPHRLMCGDSTTVEVAPLFERGKADVVFTDPPYGVLYKAAKKNAISGDLSQATIPLGFKVMIEVATNQNARIYICAGSRNVVMFYSLFEAYLQMIPHPIVWVKDSFVMRPNNYHSQYEVIYYGWRGKGGSPEFWFGDRKISDVWHVTRDTEYEHPTQKPVELPRTAIRYSCPPSGLVYDPFGGSGSTMIAAEELQRRCVMIELDPAYADVIRRRYAEFVNDPKLMP